MHQTGESGLHNFKRQADNFVCAVLPDTNFRQIYITPGLCVAVLMVLLCQYDWTFVCSRVQAD